MARRETITVSITPELRAFTRGQTGSGRYGTASEVVRAALRLLIERNGERPPSPPAAGAPSASSHA